ncbi:hypothetical protein ACWIUA_00360 [Ursidibacter sp. B-7004-1]
MNKQFRRNQRWRMNRQLNNRRRINLWLLEKRVSYLEGREEVLVLDLENTHDLMKALETKVQKLIAENQALKTTQPVGLLARVKAFLSSKGNP